MKWIKYSIVLLVILLFSGCDRFSGTPDRPDMEDIAKGSDGITIEFIPNAPPEEVIEGSVFQVGIRMQNKGITDVKNGYILLGYENEYLDLYSWENKGAEDRVRISLDGKSLDLPDGGQDVLIANIESKDIGIQREKAETSIFVTTCYNYKTTAYASICIDTDPYNMKQGTQACDLEDVSMSDQGAPVAVTRVEYKLAVSKDMGIVKPQFKIYFDNVGSGTIIAKDRADTACSSRPLAQGDINTLKINAHLSEVQLECEPNTIKLGESRDYTICTLAGGIDERQQNYYAPLSITAEYGYMNTISDTLTIVKSI